MFPSVLKINGGHFIKFIKKYLKSILVLVALKLMDFNPDVFVEQWAV